MGGPQSAIEQGTDRGVDTESLERDELSRDTVFQTLSNRRRRLVLTYLGRHPDRTVRLRDLSERIAAEENGVPIAEVSYKQRKRVYTSLYQSHLPTLHRDGIVEYNQARGTIKLTPTASAFDVYLEPPSETALPWTRYWLGFGLVAATVSIAAWLDVSPFLTSLGHLLSIALAVTVLVLAVAFIITSDDGE
ncbi:hypothetical protein [Natrialba sp. INN-245]|uniref:DUF7344 domain-containing protein n=1 Tax=Natrialba sp. INN-245 TaxID=2690967 RepID=UPI0013132723|nr:hypothetical protein [Natrialba sp. INN-245]MWV41690.1 hypothetical protein [Natrialba sp. INN-245]